MIIVKENKSKTDVYVYNNPFRSCSFYLSVFNK